MPDAIDPLDAILAAPSPARSEAEANAERLRARDALVVRYQRLVHKIARGHAGWGGEHDHDDLVQVGNLGLMRAAELYDPSRGEFKVYAGIWVRSAIRRALERAGAEEEVTTLRDATVDVADPGAVAPSEALADAELGAWVRRVGGRLSPGRRRLIELRFGLDGGGPRTLAGVAAETGVSRQAVAQREGLALGELRGLLGA